MEGTAIAVVIFAIIAAAALAVSIVAILDKDSTSSGATQSTSVPSSSQAPQVINFLESTSITTTNMTTEILRTDNLEITGQLSSGSDPSARLDGAIEVISLLAATEGVEIGSGEGTYKLPVGAGPDGAVMVMPSSGSTLEFSTAIPDGLPANIMTSKGDLLVGPSATRLPVGMDNFMICANQFASNGLGLEYQLGPGFRTSRVSLQNSQFVITPGNSSMLKSVFLDGFTPQRMLTSGYNPGFPCWESTDGYDFPRATNLNTAINNPTNSFAGFGYDRENSLVIAIASNNTIVKSTDGINWTSVTPVPAFPVFFTGRNNNYDPYRKLFIADTGVTSQAMATSPDGETWTQRSTPASFNALQRDIAFGEPAIVAGCTGGSMFSTDGITWSETTPNITNTFGVAWSPYLKIYTLVSSTGDEIYTSTDGKTFTDTGNTTPSGPFRHIVWAPKYQKFVGVGDNGVIAMSSDGKTYDDLISHVGFGTAFNAMPAFDRLYIGGSSWNITIVDSLMKDVGFSGTCAQRRLLAPASSLPITVPAVNPPVAAEYKAVALPDTSFENYLTGSGTNGILIPSEAIGTWEYTFTFAFKHDTPLTGTNVFYFRAFDAAAYLAGETDNASSQHWCVADGQITTVQTGSFTGMMVQTGAADIALNVRIAQTDTVTSTNATFYQGTSLVAKKKNNMRTPGNFS